MKISNQLGWRVGCAAAACVALAGCTRADSDDTGNAGDNRVTFAVDMREPADAGWFDPATERVGIRGGTPPLSWGETIEGADPDGDLVFEVAITFDSLETSLVAFKFKVEGVDNPNDGWESGGNRSVDVATIRRVDRRFDKDRAPIPRTLTGNVEHHAGFADTTSGLAVRDLLVYLPPGYETSGDRYPVLYMHDGVNVFDASEVGGEWRMDEQAEEMIADGRMRPAIIVGVGNTPDRTNEYTPTASETILTLSRPTPGRGLDGTYVAANEFSLTVQTRGDSVFVRPADRDEDLYAPPSADGGFAVSGTGYTLFFETDRSGRTTGVTARQRPEGGWGDRYGRFLVEQVKPFIDRTYRTLPDRDHTSLGGSSLGGLITMYLGLEYADVFSGLLVVSPSVWWDDRYLLRRVRSESTDPELKIWLDMGGDEGRRMVDDARSLARALGEKQWAETDVRFVEVDAAGHSEQAWAARADDMLLFLYGTR